MTLLTRPIAERLPAWASPQQQGFIRGRGTLQNVLRLDSSARCLTMRALALQWDGPRGEPGEGDDADDDPLQVDRRRRRRDDHDDAQPPRHRRRANSRADATNSRREASSRRPMDHDRRCDENDEAMQPRRRRRLNDDDATTTRRSDESSRRTHDRDVAEATMGTGSPDTLTHDSTCHTSMTPQLPPTSHHPHTSTSGSVPAAHYLRTDNDEGQPTGPRHERHTNAHSPSQPTPLHHGPSSTPSLLAVRRTRPTGVTSQDGVSVARCPHSCAPTTTTTRNDIATPPPPHPHTDAAAQPPHRAPLPTPGRPYRSPLRATPRARRPSVPHDAHPTATPLRRK